MLPFSLFHGKWCERLYQMMWEIIPNDVRDYTKWCERLHQIMWEIIPNDVRDYTKWCERLYQILVGWEYRFQGVQRIKISVDIRLDLLLLLGLKMMCLGYDPLIPIACIQCWDTPDGGQWTCPKHVEYFIK